MDYGDRVYSVARDGTDRRVVQSLEFDPENYIQDMTVYPILHRGYVYFAYNGVLYRAKLGDKLDNAQRLWGEDGDHVVKDREDIQIYDSILAFRSFTLWADGDLIYFMSSIPQADGTYKETLFAYDASKDSEDGASVRQLWQMPDAREVGNWTSAGVSASKWYITGGYIYFYLSGGDFWRGDLETDENEKLADTHERATYGKAIFSDEYMCLLY